MIGRCLTLYYADVNIYHLAVVLPIALIIYDYVLTVDKEISCIWKRKFSLASVIFFCGSTLR